MHASVHSVEEPAWSSSACLLHAHIIIMPSRVWSPTHHGSRKGTEGRSIWGSCTASGPRRAI